MEGARRSKRDKVQISIAENDTMWLEVYVPQHLRVDFSEDEIARHLKHLTQLNEKEPDENGNSFQTHLYEVVLD